MSEVSDLKNIIITLRDYVVCSTGRSQVHLAELSKLSTLINRAKAIIIELDNFVGYRIARAGSLRDPLKISRRQWINARSTIENFRQSLRDVRLNVIAQMAVFNS